MKRLLIILLVFFMIIGITPVSAEESTVIYTDQNVVVYQNSNGSKTALVHLPEDVQQGDSILIYSDKNTGTSVYVDIDEILEFDSVRTLGYGNTSWSGSVPSGTTKLTPHISTSAYSNIGFTMSITSTGAKINSVYNPALLAIAYTVSNISLSLLRSTATSGNPAYATMNWTSTFTQNGYVISSAACYFTVYMNSTRELRMEWYCD